MKLVLNKLTMVFFTLAAAITVTPVMATEKTEASAVVSTASCKNLANTTQPFILVLNTNEDLLGSITQCAKDAQLRGASISGLGQVHNPSLAYFTSKPDDKPTITTFPGFYELASISGNITNNAGKYYTHTHAVIADKQFHGIAGHVNSAKIGLTAEITIVPFLASAERTVNPKTGFGPLVQ